jgi:serine/threonine-protein kinase HipA
MARQLDVFLGSNKIGVLEQDNHGSLWFGYDTKWLASGSAVPLSASLPLREERYRSKECRPFFAGLLPEETSRKLVASRFGVSERNDFALLEQIGAECAGAVSLQHAGELPSVGIANYRGIELSELEEKLRGLPKAPLLAGEDGIRLSLAGAQGKAAVAIRDGSYLLPLDGSPSTALVAADASSRSAAGRDSSPPLPGLFHLGSHYCRNCPDPGYRHKRLQSGSCRKTVSRMIVISNMLIREA